MPEPDRHQSTSERFIERLQLAFVDGDSDWQGKAAEARNLARLQAQYRAIDMAAALASLHDQIELELFCPPELPIRGRWAGLAEVSAAIERNFGALAVQQAELLSVVAQGDCVVLDAVERGKIRATDADYHIRWTQIFTFRDDKIVRISDLAAVVS